MIMQANSHCPVKQHKWFPSKFAELDVLARSQWMRFSHYSKKMFLKQDLTCQIRVPGR